MIDTMRLPIPVPAVSRDKQIGLRSISKARPNELESVSGRVTASLTSNCVSGSSIGLPVRNLESFVEAGRVPTTGITDNQVDWSDRVLAAGFEPATASDEFAIDRW